MWLQVGREKAAPIDENVCKGGREQEPFRVRFGEADQARTRLPSRRFRRRRKRSIKQRNFSFMVTETIL